jgi:hypothetical protein
MRALSYLALVLLATPLAAQELVSQDAPRRFPLTRLFPARKSGRI